MSRGFYFGLVLGLAALTGSIARSWIARSAATSAPQNRIACPRIYPTIAIAIGAFFVVASMAGLLREPGPKWLTFLVPGAAVIMLFLPLLYRSEVRLTDRRLCGPARLVGPFIWFDRNSIALDDIEAVGSTNNGYTYYQARDGRRVYVNNGYPGSIAFNATLASLRRE